MISQVEHLEGEIAELKQSLSEKREQEAAMLQVQINTDVFNYKRMIYTLPVSLVAIFIYCRISQVLMRVEQEQRVTEDARLSAEQDAAAQRYAVHVLQVLSFSFISRGILFTKVIISIIFSTSHGYIHPYQCLNTNSSII